MNAIDKLIKTMNKLKASHLHLGPKNPQAFRIDDKIHTFNLDKTYTDSLKKMLYKIMPAKKVEIFKQTGHIRFVYISGQTNRYRITAYTHGKDVHAIIKRLSQKLLNVNILSTEELNLPPVIAYLAAIPAGLVICTGPENSGITTTLAAIINAANTRYRHAHVITIDNPIEYVHTNCNCLVEQLEISDQILSKQECLRNALNAETDIILCEGMDDAETISLMLDAASGGRLVLTTFPHYFPMKNMFESILKKFPAHYRDLITSKLANVFCAAISHEKFKRVDGNNAYCVANEILIGIPAVRALIREDKMHQLENMMKIGKKHGMQLMDESITGLYNKGLISAEDACMKAIDKTHFGQILKSSPEDEKKMKFFKE